MDKCGQVPKSPRDLVPKSACQLSCRNQRDMEMVPRDLGLVPMVHVVGYLRYLTKHDGNLGHRRWP